MTWQLSKQASSFPDATASAVCIAVCGADAGTTDFLSQGRLPAAHGCSCLRDSRWSFLLHAAARQHQHPCTYYALMPSPCLPARLSATPPLQDAAQYCYVNGAELVPYDNSDGFCESSHRIHTYRHAI